MGRRKIEIQPITHERNRSVTFLKRKNGLFKKAYELGVLCSVDVAVIIFEERPGHEVKFHSYSSSDLRDIVQRQIRFQGDKDVRGPADFSGAGGKYDDDADDLDDDEEEESNRRHNKRKASRLNIQPELNEPDYLPPVPRNGLPHLPGLPMGAGPQGHYDDNSSIGSLMPVSNDRVSSLRSSTRGSKRQRTSESGLSRGNSPSLDHDRSYIPNSHLAGGRQSTRAIRSHDQSGPGAMMMHPPHIYPPGTSPGGYGSQQYNQLFPLGGPGGPMSMGPPPGPLPPLPPRFEPQYDPALYQHQYSPSVMRQPSIPGGRNDGGNVNEHRDNQPLNGPQRERGGSEVFAAFLEADERSRQMAAAAAQRQHQEQINWPSSTPPTTPSTPIQQGPNATPATNSSTNWFDIFSGGSGPTADSGPGEGNNIQLSRISNLENLSADIARILVNPVNSAPTQQQQPGETVVRTPPSGGGSVGSTTAPLPQSMQEAAAADEGEAEKDAEGEDEDIEGGGDKKLDPTTGSEMAVDVLPRQRQQPSITKAGDPDKEIGMKEDTYGDGAGDDDAEKPKPKQGRGRPRKSAAVAGGGGAGGSGSRGKGKAKG